MDVQTGRIYQETPKGYTRVLVDRLWPRGIRKDRVLWDSWMKEIAPSSMLRSWYHAHPDARQVFVDRYREELLKPAMEPVWEELMALADARPIILLTASQDVEASQVPVLRDMLLRRLARQAPVR